jgi:hypothetical protein
MHEDPHVTWLLASTIVALMAGPFFSWARHRMPRVLPTLKFITAMSVGLLVFGFVLPDAFRQADWWIVPAAFMGFVLLNLLERVGHIGHRQVHAVAVLVSVAGLVVHMALDGVALHDVGHAHRHLLGVGVVLHRIPMGIALWGLVHPRFGKAGGWTAIVAGSAATVFGTGFGEDALLLLGTFSLGIFQAFVSGALLHVVFHGQMADHHHRGGHSPGAGDHPPPTKAP